MAINPPSYKHIFLALAFFKDRPQVQAVRIGTDIIRKKETLRKLYALTENKLKNYRQYRNNPKEFIEKLVQGYRQNDYEIFHLMNTPQPESIQPPIKPTPLEQQAGQTKQEKQDKKKTELPDFNVKPANIETPQQVKNMASGLQIFIKTNFTKYLATPEVMSLLSKGINAVVGGGGQAVLNVGRGTLNTGENLLTNLSRLDNFAGKFSVFGKTGLIVTIALILGLTFFISGIATPATKLEASPLISSDLASCQFFRGDQSPPSASYQSPLLINYFNEAAQITTVPAQVLAAIVRVETPGSVNWTDENMSSQACPESGDGALGIMQIIPHFSPRTDAICRDCIASGASYIGKTVDQLTRADYCDPKTSVFLGAGFILKKLSYLNLGDGTRWDPGWTQDQDIIYKVAESFYGCLKYGGSTQSCNDSKHRYNYGQDLWNSLQACQQTVASCPVDGAAIRNPSYQTYLLDPFKGGHCSPAYGSCPGNSRRAKSVDIDTQGQDVKLPTIQGQPVKWTYLANFSLDKPSDCESGTANCGIALIFQANLGENSWTLHLLHIDTNSLQIALHEEKPTGSVVGKTVPGTYLHINVGKNISNPGNPPIGAFDLDPGWLNPDTDLKMCI